MGLAVVRSASCFTLAFSLNALAVDGTPPEIGARPDTALISGARLRALAGQPQEAVQTLDVSIADLKDGQRDRKALLQMAAGLILFQANLDVAALAHFSGALNDGSRIADTAHFYLAELAKRKPDLKLAVSEFQKVIDLHPPRASELDARYELAEIFIQTHQPKPALQQLEVLRKYLKNDPRYPEVLYQLIRLKRSVGSTFDVCRTARELYSKYPTFSAISSGNEVWGPILQNDLVDGKRIGCSASRKELKTRVRRLWIGGDNQRAESELRLLDGTLDDDSDDSSKDNSAVTGISGTGSANKQAGAIDGLLVNHLIADGRVDEALKILLQHYEQEKKHVGYLQLLAKASASAGENQLTIASYDKAFELAPRSKNGVNGLFQAAFTSYQIQDYDGATRRFEHFLKISSKSSLSRDAQWYMAWIRYLRGDYQGAIESFGVLAKAPVVSPRRLRRRRRGAPSANPESDTIAHDRLQYWTAMSLLKLGHAPEATVILQNLVRDPALGYYTLLAYERLKAIPNAKIPDEVDFRLGLKKPDAATGAPKSAEADLNQAIKQASEEAAAEASETADSRLEPRAEDEEEIDSQEEFDAAEGEPLASESIKNQAMTPRFERARDLEVIGLEDRARRELLEIERRVSSAADRHALMTEFQHVKNYDRSSFIADVGFSGDRLRGGLRGDGKTYWDFAYPRAWDAAVAKSAKADSISEELIWGIMRSESHYRQDAQSPVGALGLMQLMPFTARKVAQILGIESFDPNSLLEPETNIRIGARYLQRLAEKFSGKIPLVAAGYNAGPHRVYAWVHNFGTIDMDEFVEHIPYVETRNYVKRVVRNASIYALLYHGNVKSLRSLVQPVGLKLEDPAALKEIW